MDSKLNKFLAAILIIIAVSVFVIVGFNVYNFFHKKVIDSKADHAIEEFDKKIQEIGGDVTTDNDEVSANDEESDSEDSEDSDDNNNDNDDDSDGDYSDGSYRRSTSRVSYNYNGYDVVGKIYIPRTKANYPIFSEATLSSMNVSVGLVYGPGLNEVGNTVIMGHNYKNGTFFSNNYKLKIGDYIYITDSYGWKLRYKIYNKYETDTSDFDYATRNTYGEREISLASCTDDSKARLIIWAKAE